MTNEAVRHRTDSTQQRPMWAWLLALLGALALFATACGDDDTTTATDEPAPSGETEADAAPAPTGEPVKLGSVLTINNPAWSNNNVRLVQEAWADYVNSELGGINGRPLEVISCDDEGDPGKTTACVQDLIDEGVVAFVNNSSLVFGANALPVMEAEGIPNIGGWPISPPEYSSALNFPTAPGASGSYPSLAAFLASEGAESLALVYTDTPSGHGVADQIGALWADLTGGEFTGVSFDPTAADFAPTLTRVNDADPDGVILAVGEGAAGRMFQAAAIVGLDARIAATSTAATQAVFEAAGDAVEGVVFSVATLPAGFDSDEDVQRYNEIMAEFAPDVELSPQSGVAASSIQYAVDILMSVEGEVTSESIIAALDGATVEPFMSHSLSPDLAPAALPRVWNPYNMIVEYTGGELVPLGEDLEESDHVDIERGVTWFTGFVPGA